MENKNNTIYMDDIVQTEEKNLVRDVNSKALLASNKSELEMHRNRAKQVKAAQNSIKELNILKEKLHGMESDLDEIKALLKNIHQGNRN